MTTEGEIEEQLEKLLAHTSGWHTSATNANSFCSKLTKQQLVVVSSQEVAKLLVLFVLLPCKCKVITTTLRAESWIMNYAA